MATGARMHKVNAADELAEVRVAIARLRLREARLCAMILSEPEAAYGLHFRAEIAERPTRIFDLALLPASILSDPRYWRDSLAREVCCLPLSEPRMLPPPHAGCALH